MWRRCGGEVLIALGGKMMLSQDVFSSLARRPRHIRRRELLIRTSSLRVSLAPELPKRCLSSTVFAYRYALSIVGNFFFRPGQTPRNMAQELITSGKMSLQEKLDKIRSPKLQNQHQVVISPPFCTSSNWSRLPLCCLRSRIP